MITCCGMYCIDCPSFAHGCAGCEAVRGKVHWSRMIGKDTCPIFACCKNKGYAHCGKCGQLPCEMWIDMRDPSVSEDDHLAGVVAKIQALRGEP